MAAKLQQIMAAIALLKNEKLRGFRVDIETDSTISADAQQNKEQTVEFLGAVTGFMEKAGQMAMAVPAAAPFLGKLMQWGIRQFRTGRDLEAAADEFVEAMGAVAKAAQEGGDEDPALQVEQVKAQAEMQKVQADGQIEQLKGQIELQKMQMEMAIKTATAEQEKELAALKMQIEVTKASLEYQKMQREEEAAAAEHSRQMQLGSLQVLQDQEGHRANMEGIEAKREATVAAARAKPANGGQR
jgi:hypothetical protein